MFSLQDLIFDEEGKLLVVKPTYKNYWHIPGDVIENNESPYCACIREVLEETNLEVIPLRLLAVNYTGIEEEKIGALVFVSNCRNIKSDLKRNIKIPEDEIEDFRFIDKKDVYKYLDERIAKIVDEYFKSMIKNETIYLDNMKRIL